MTLLSSDITKQWLRQLESNSPLDQQDEPAADADDDNYYYTATPETLITTSDIQQFSIGTGAEILESILPVIASAQSEVLLVTCFWARSRSQEALSRCLKELSQRAVQEGRTVQVRLCFSSRSLLQKLWQTSSSEGEVYPPSCWESTLGLPSPDELGGLDLTVKSVFVRPLSVMHPKFVVADRTRVFLPSCNVSWEDWFEGCIELRGPIVECLLEFWKHFWGRGQLPVLSISTSALASIGSTHPSTDQQSQSSTHTTPLLATEPPTPISSIALNLENIRTVLLPSPHHPNPRFRPLHPTSPAPPPTPLNLFLLTAFSNAKSNIYIQTPNLTSPPVLSALLAALQHSVDIHIVTSSRMMVLEQLVTAGNVTEMAVWDLQRRYSSLCKQQRGIITTNSNPNSNSLADAEAGAIKQPGRLSIRYYHPRTRAAQAKADEPVKSHLKLTIVDNELVVLGSGNMDRASWYTSQELGVAFFSREMAERVRASVDSALEGRLD
jgi:phosphatidylserine/phosphatidylglycerophosphate/cardiolipin synthase-like enzyme